MTGHSYDEANAFQRAMRRFGASGAGSWLFARVLQRIDRPVFRVSGGRNTFTSLVAGIPVVWLTTVGARSGAERTVPVLGLPTAEGFAVIASNFGQHSHPAWFYNLRANPQGRVSVNGEAWAFRASEAKGDARARIWEHALKVYPGWSQYERRAANRTIAVFVLDPA